MSNSTVAKAIIKKILKPTKTKEGVGASVLRLVGTSEVRNLDPFLLMDHFSGRLPGGFPDHPHRGFETVSYILEGTCLHEDSKGHSGEIRSGDVQWMTAGKGIIHAEMPGSSKEDSVGFQLWINLPKEKKMIEPFYQEFESSKIPVIKKDGVTAKVICGNEWGMEGAIKPNWPVQYVDFTLDKNSNFQKEIPLGWNCFVYVYEGVLNINGTELATNSGIVFENLKHIQLIQFQAGSVQSKFLFLGGKPIGEPIVQYGPFVMNTQEEISQAFEDYQSSKNGFEDSKTWKSGIRKLSDDFGDL